MDYVFVRDEEGYVYKKIASQVTENETIISEKQYMKESGLLAYEKQFNHSDAHFVTSVTNGNCSFLIALNSFFNDK